MLIGTWTVLEKKWHLCADTIMWHRHRNRHKIARQLAMVITSAVYTIMWHRHRNRHKIARQLAMVITSAVYRKKRIGPHTHFTVQRRRWQVRKATSGHWKRPFIPRAKCNYL